MANMSYCRFHNTLLALRDCKAALEERDLPKPSNQEEYWAMLRLIEVCGEIQELAVNELCKEQPEDKQTEEGNGIACPSCGEPLYDVANNWEENGYKCRACDYKGWGA